MLERYTNLGYFLVFKDATIRVICRVALYIDIPL